MLRELDISWQTALFEFRLAPLETRRDIAMLGVIHRTLLGLGPPHFSSFFQLSPHRHSSRRHPFQVLDTRQPGRRLCMLDRSIVGLIWVYNLLPFEAVSTRSVSDFQKILQLIVKYFCLSAHPHWPFSLSNRMSASSHPLLSLPRNWILSLLE